MEALNPEQNPQVMAEDRTPPTLEETFAAMAKENPALADFMRRLHRLEAKFGNKF